MSSSVLLLRTLALGLVVVAPCLLPAQVIHSLDNRALHLPEQFVITPAGVKYAKAGVRDPIVVTWEQIDVAVLAKEEPEIEIARQSAIIANKSTWFTVTSAIRVNYYREFLSLPVNVTFQRRTLAVSNQSATYAISATGFVAPTGEIKVSGFISGESNAVTTFIDKTRHPLAITIEGAFLVLGDDNNPEARSLLRELQYEHQGFFQNIGICLETLRTAYPKDPEITAVIKAVAKLAHADTAVDIDSVRALAKFAKYCRQKAAQN